MSNTIPLQPDAGSVRVAARPAGTVPFGRRLAAVALIAGFEDGRLPDALAAAH